MNQEGVLTRTANAKVLESGMSFDYSVLRKVCTKCGILKSVEEYHKAPGGNLGRRGDCKSCVRARQKANYVKNLTPCPTCGGRKTQYTVKCRKCAVSHEVSNEDAKWQIDKDGYLYRWTKGKKIRQHRWIMEKSIGRSLLPNESVHHINGVKHDNRIENLELWITHQPRGQRPSDLVVWAKEILDLYG